MVVRVFAALGLALLASCGPAPVPRADTPRLGQWIWTRDDAARFAQSAQARPGLEAGVYIGAVHCDARTGALHARAGLPPSVAGMTAVTAVIRFEDGLDRCRTGADGAARFDRALDSAVTVLRTRGTGTAVLAVQLDYDAPQRALPSWAASVRYLTAHALARDSVWVTSLVAHLREPGYGDLFRDVVRGHVLQVFDTGEPATDARVTEAIRLATRADLPFRLGLGAFERRTASGRTEHRAWFAQVDRFADAPGFRGVWVFPAGRAWLSLLRSAS